MELAKKILKSIGLWEIVRKFYLALKATIYSLRFRNDKAVESLYNKEYFIKYNYSQNNPSEVKIKEAQSEFIIRAANPKKVLIAGCASGELVRALRKKGVDAWGFDITKDLEEIVYPEVKDFVRIGSLFEIPFNKSDNFDALVAFDVFEHIPIWKVNSMIEEIGRLSPEYLFTIIAHEYIEVGHITLKPIGWWKNKLKKYYNIIDRHIDTSDLPKVHGVGKPGSDILIWKHL